MRHLSLYAQAWWDAQRFDQESREMLGVTSKLG
jgi:hypothetical protein